MNGNMDGPHKENGRHDEETLELQTKPARPQKLLVESVGCNSEIGKYCHKDLEEINSPKSMGTTQSKEDEADGSGSSSPQTRSRSTSLRDGFVVIEQSNSNHGEIDRSNLPLLGTASELSLSPNANMTTGEEEATARCLPEHQNGLAMSLDFASGESSQINGHKSPGPSLNESGTNGNLQHEKTQSKPLHVHFDVDESPNDTMSDRSQTHPAGFCINPTTEGVEETVTEGYSQGSSDITSRVSHSSTSLVDGILSCIRPAEITINGQLPSSITSGFSPVGAGEGSKQKQSFENSHRLNVNGSSLLRNMNDISGLNGPDSETLESATHSELPAANKLALQETMVVMRPKSSEPNSLFVNTSEKISESSTPENTFLAPSDLVTIIRTRTPELECVFEASMKKASISLPEASVSECGSPYENLATHSLGSCEKQEHSRENTGKEADGSNTPYMALETVWLQQTDMEEAEAAYHIKSCGHGKAAESEESKKKREPSMHSKLMQQLNIMQRTIKRFKCRVGNMLVKQQNKLKALEMFTDSLETTVASFKNHTSDKLLTNIMNLRSFLKGADQLAKHMAQYQWKLGHPQSKIVPGFKKKCKEKCQVSEKFCSMLIEQMDVLSKLKLDFHLPNLDSLICEIEAVSKALDSENAVQSFASIQQNFNNGIKCLTQDTSEGQSIQLLGFEESDIINRFVPTKPPTVNERKKMPFWTNVEGVHHKTEGGDNESDLLPEFVMSGDKVSKNDIRNSRGWGRKDFDGNRGMDSHSQNGHKKNSQTHQGLLPQGPIVNITVLPNCHSNQSSKMAFIQALNHSQRQAEVGYQGISSQFGPRPVTTSTCELNPVWPKLQHESTRPGYPTYLLPDPYPRRSIVGDSSITHPPEKFMSRRPPLLPDPPYPRNRCVGGQSTMQTNSSLSNADSSGRRHLVDYPYGIDQESKAGEVSYDAMSLFINKIQELQKSSLSPEETLNEISAELSNLSDALCLPVTDSTVSNSSVLVSTDKEEGQPISVSKTQKQQNRVFVAKNTPIHNQERQEKSSTLADSKTLHHPKEEKISFAQELSNLVQNIKENTTIQKIMKEAGVNYWETCTTAGGVPFCLTRGLDGTLLFSVGKGSNSNNHFGSPRVIQETKSNEKEQFRAPTERYDHQENSHGKDLQEIPISEKPVSTVCGTSDPQAADQTQEKSTCISAENEVFNEIHKPISDITEKMDTECSVKIQDEDKISSLKDTGSKINPQNDCISDSEKVISRQFLQDVDEKVSASEGSTKTLQVRSENEFTEKRNEMKDANDEDHQFQQDDHGKAEADNEETGSFKTGQDNEEISPPSPPKVGQYNEEISSLKTGQNNVEISPPKAEHDNEAISLPKAEQDNEEFSLPKAEQDNEEISSPKAEQDNEEISLPKAEQYNEETRSLKTGQDNEETSSSKAEQDNEKISSPKAEQDNEEISLPKAEQYNEETRSLKTGQDNEETSSSKAEQDNEEMSSPKAELGNEEISSLKTGQNNEEISPPKAEHDNEEVSSLKTGHDNEEISLPKAEQDNEEICLPKAEQDNEEISLPKAEQDNEEMRLPSPPNIGQDNEVISLPKAEQDNEEICLPKAEQDNEVISLPKAEQDKEEMISLKTGQDNEEMSSLKTGHDNEGISLPKAEQDNEEISSPKAEQDNEEISLPKAEQYNEETRSLKTGQDNEETSSPKAEQDNEKISSLKTGQDNEEISSPKAEEDNEEISLPMAEQDNEEISSPMAEQDIQEMSSSKTGQDNEEMSPPSPPKIRQDNEEISLPKAEQDNEEISSPKAGQDNEEMSLPKAGQDSEEMSSPKAGQDNEESSSPKVGQDNEEINSPDAGQVDKKVCPLKAEQDSVKINSNKTEPYEILQTGLESINSKKALQDNKQNSEFEYIHGSNEECELIDFYMVQEKDVENSVFEGLKSLEDNRCGAGQIQQAQESSIPNIDTVSSDHRFNHEVGHGESQKRNTEDSNFYAQQCQHPLNNEGTSPTVVDDVSKKSCEQKNVGAEAPISSSEIHKGDMPEDGKAIGTHAGHQDKRKKKNKKKSDPSASVDKRAIEQERRKRQNKKKSDQSANVEEPEIEIEMPLYRETLKFMYIPEKPGVNSLMRSDGNKLMAMLRKAKCDYDLKVDQQGAYGTSSGYQKMPKVIKLKVVAPNMPSDNYLSGMNSLVSLEKEGLMVALDIKNESVKMFSVTDSTTDPVFQGTGHFSLSHAQPLFMCKFTPSIVAVSRKGRLLTVLRCIHRFRHPQFLQDISCARQYCGLAYVRDQVLACACYTEHCVDLVKIAEGELQTLTVIKDQYHRPETICYVPTTKTIVFLEKRDSDGWYLVGVTETGNIAFTRSFDPILHNTWNIMHVNGSIAACCKTNDRFMILQSDGKFMFDLLFPNTLDHPFGMCFDSRNRLFVANEGTPNNGVPPFTKPDIRIFLLS